MTDKTKSYFYLCKLYEYAIQINNTLTDFNYDVDKLYNNQMIRHGVNMCLLQMGEFAARIRDINEDLYNSSEYDLHKIKGLRDRIAHSYGDLDMNILKDTISNSIPNTIDIIEKELPIDLLENPYQLNEIEYDELIEELENKDKGFSI